jgi:hypothetical protein
LTPTPTHETIATSKRETKEGSEEMDTYYMHTSSGDVATKQYWQEEFNNMDRETWFGVDTDECRDWHWLDDQKYLVAVKLDDNYEWVEA